MRVCRIKFIQNSDEESVGVQKLQYEGTKAQSVRNDQCEIDYYILQNKVSAETTTRDCSKAIFLEMPCEYQSAQFCGCKKKVIVVLFHSCHFIQRRLPMVGSRKKFSIFYRTQHLYSWKAFKTPCWPFFQICSSQQQLKMGTNKHFYESPTKIPDEGKILYWKF